MTDRIHSITLVLDKDTRIDDAEALIGACYQFRSVIAVTPNVTDFTAHVAEERARSELIRRVLKTIGGDT